MSVSPLQKKIYNSYLSCLAKANNRPFKARQDFSSLENCKREALEKIESFFLSHPHINIDMFMDAPYKVYADKVYYSIEDYARPTALKTYFLYRNLLDSASPDSAENLSIIKDSIIFIKEFCIEKNIPLMQYLNYSESVTFSWCSHLLKQDISIYNILAFSYFGINIYMLINKLPPDEKELFLYQYNDSISEYVKKLNDSEKAKLLLLNGYKKIEKLIEQHLKTD